MQFFGNSLFLIAALAAAQGRGRLGPRPKDDGKRPGIRPDKFRGNDNDDFEETVERPVRRFRR